jgi:hypothetical protein
VSCVPNSVSVSWLPILIVLLSSFCVLCAQMMSVSLDCPFWIAPLSSSCVLCTKWAIKRHWHYWAHKTQSEDKGTIKNGQSRDTDIIWAHKTQNEDKGTIKMGNQETIAPLSSSCDLCTQWCQCLLIVHSWLSLCFRSVSCVPNGVSVSWLSIIGCPFVFVLFLVYPNGVSVIGYISHRMKTKGQSRMDNQETLTPFGHTRHRTKTKGQSKVSLDCPLVFVLCLVYPSGVNVSWLSILDCLRPVSCVPK